MDLFFLKHLESLGLWIYLLIFLAVMIEGDLVLFAVLFLAKAGLLNLWGTMGVIVLGVLIGNRLWYELGLLFYKKEGNFNRVVNRFSGRFDAKLTEHPKKTLFVSKFLYGMHRWVLIRAGMIRVPVWTFFQADVIATAFWLVLVCALAFTFNLALPHMVKYFRYGEIILGVGLFGIFVFESALTAFWKFIFRNGNGNLKQPL